MNEEMRGHSNSPGTSLGPAEDRIVMRLQQIRERLNEAHFSPETIPLDDCVVGDIADAGFRRSREFKATGIVVQQWGQGPNYLVIHRRNADLSRVQVRCHSSNGIIYIGPDCALEGVVRMHADGGMYIVCGDNRQPARFHATLWSRNNTILIAPRTTSNGTQLVSMGANASIVVGEDCMFSAGSWVKTSDMHCIVDVATHKGVNRHGNVGDVVLGKHVWVGQDVIIMLGVKIGSGSIVGAKSFVNGDIAERTLSVGVPAREVRTGVTWLRSHAFVAAEYAAVRDDLGLE